MEYEFPKGFMWGGASSGPQSEGGSTEGHRVESEWDYWFKKEPERFFKGVGPAVTSDFYHKYPEYIKKMKRAGIKSYRTSIQWSRMIKDCSGTVNEEGVEFYNRVIGELIENGIEPMMCLHHFDLPVYWVEKGGFENRDIVSAFARFASVCFERFGDRVKYWTMFNEPVIIPETGYLYQRHYPAVCDARRAAQVGYHVQLASSRAVAEFRNSGCSGKIGIIINLTPTYCEDEQKEGDRKAARTLDLIFNRSFLDPSVKGIYPEELTALLKDEGIMPEVGKEDGQLIWENRVDYLGVNYYHPRRARARRSAYEGPLMPEKYYEPYEMKGQKMNRSRGWEIYEPAVYDIAVNLRDHYGNIPWYMSENGMGIQDEERFLNQDGVVEDGYRIEFIKEHLKYLHKAIGEGCRCFGYHVWAPFDCWSWVNAYKNRYGLLRVDIDNGCRISMKKSGVWFKQLSEQNGF